MHGESKPGPHGGLVRMPGEFHVEVVPRTGAAAFDAYLLDLQNRNPITFASRVRGYIEKEDKKSWFSCEPVSDHFLCNVPSDLNGISGQLTLQTVKQIEAGSPTTGRPVNYPWPLSKGMN